MSSFCTTSLPSICPSDFSEAISQSESFPEALVFEMMLSLFSPSSSSNYSALSSMSPFSLSSSLFSISSFGGTSLFQSPSVTDFIGSEEGTWLASSCYYSQFIFIPLCSAIVLYFFLSFLQFSECLYSFINSRYSNSIKPL